MTTSPPKINADGFYELRDAAKALGIRERRITTFAKGCAADTENASCCIDGCRGEGD